MATVIPQVSIQDLVFKKSTPNTMGAINAGMALSNSFAEQQQAKRAEQAAAQQQQLAGQVSEGLLTGNQSPQALAQLMSQNPDMSAKILKQAGIFNDAGREELGRTAFELRSMPAGAERNARIQQVAEQLQARGGNPKIALGLLNLDGAEQDRQLINMELTAKTSQERQAIAEGKQNFDLDVRKTDIQQQQANTQSANVRSQINERNRPEAQAQYTLAPGEIRMSGQQVVAKGLPITAEIPQVLLSGLPDQVANKAAAAYNAAGGGKDGLNAYGKIVDQGGETARRVAAPTLIKQSFPGATQAEMTQLLAAMDASKTTDEGLKAAQLVRGGQRQMKKAKVFQIQAVDLLTNIIGNPQLGDVTGSLEGIFDTRIGSDAEAGLIADIKEAADILTSDNMDLMSGVLSESDLALLKNMSSGALNRKRPTADFLKRATELRNRLKAAILLTPEERLNNNEAADAVLVSKFYPVIPTLPPSGRTGGRFQVDPSGIGAFVFPDGSYEEVPNGL